MKLVIPPEFQIGPHLFKIRWGDKYLDIAHIRAHENCKDQIIRLHTGQSTSATFETLLHEVDHIVCYLYGIEHGDEESALIARSVGFCQFLMSIGIEPDFSQVPEELFAAPKHKKGEG